MPKKILFESSIHQFLSAARKIANKEHKFSIENYNLWETFILSLQFSYIESGIVEVSWRKPRFGIEHFNIKEAKLYVRGDNENQYMFQKQAGMLYVNDIAMEVNEKFFTDIVIKIAKSAGLIINGENLTYPNDINPNRYFKKGSKFERLNSEEKFHNKWADSEDVFSINVKLMNESCTAPEMRFIKKMLGDLRKKTLLDVGCGLGEASVYFALEGADVTAIDLSQKMLDATLKLAKKNNVSVKTHKSAAEDFCLNDDTKFDIIYLGNLFHHVEIESTITRILRHIEKGGQLISWDPVAYNPLINIYRKIAREVRTKDEHPLKLRDIEVFKKYFGKVEIKWFWLTTLLVFLIMALIQRRNPNKERYWKKIVEEGESWARIYKPLERLDLFLLKLFPFLGPLCWNVVICASEPKQIIK